MPTYPAKLLDVRNVVRKDRKWWALVEAVKLGVVVYLHIIPDSLSKAARKSGSGHDWVEFIISYVEWPDTCIRYTRH